MSYIRRTNQQYCLLTGSYTVYNTTYSDLIQYHLDNNADVTLLYNTEPLVQENADRFQDLRLYMNDNGRVVDMEFNSMLPTSTSTGMDAYVIHKDLLVYLTEDAIARGKYNFVSDVLIPNLNRLKIYGFEHKGFVGRLHSVASYFKLNMDMLDKNVQKELFHTEHPVYTMIRDEVPAKYGNNAVVKNSLIANGCIIEGTVVNSVLFRSIYVGKGTTIKDSIIMQDSEVYQNCWLENVILDKQVQVRSGRRLIGNMNYPVIIRKGAVV
jgi:glucose-1-phosphate adenylyltransferase